MGEQYDLIAARPLRLPPGYRANALAAGLKPSGAPDLALVAADRPVPCAGTFTQSAIKAAPVKYSQAQLERGTARAIFTNAGIANASTGRRGMEDTVATAEGLATLLQCAPGEVLVSSTGVIGQRLNRQVILDHLPPLVNGLRPECFDEAAAAIQTTDTVRKDVGVRFDAGGRPATLVGMCKGAAMIAPNMATMLAYLFTDAAVEPTAVRRALGAAVERTFNCITVDGDTSTNDTVLLFANGEAGNDPIGADGPGYAAFAAAVEAACGSLAEQIIRDAEGATKFVTIHVTGAPTDAAARQIGLTIANSPLVKTAVFGADPNYGRLIMAVGRAGVPVDEADLSLRCGEIPMLEGGEVVPFDQAAARAYLEAGEPVFHVIVGPGPGRARILTSDLSYDYVRLNAEYTT